MVHMPVWLWLRLLPQSEGAKWSFGVTLLELFDLYELIYSDVIKR